MSLSVSGSNANNPFSYLQALWQQGSSANGTQPQSDPLSELLAALDQQGAGAASGTNGIASSTNGATGTMGSTSPQFGPQTLQALLALQDNGVNPQSLFSQLANAANDADQTGNEAAGQAQQSQGQQDQHHHHHWDASGSDSSNGGSGGQDPLAMLTGATSQTTTNANGSTTTSITYANGSSVSMTTAAAGSSGSSDSSSSSAGGASVTGNNYIEQLIAMQAQLLTPSSTQSIATA